MRRDTTMLLALLAACALAPADAQAQFGGLKRKLEQQMGRAVLGEEGGRAPKFDDRVLEITDARLEQLVRGLRAEAVEVEREEKRMAAEDAKAADYERRGEAYAKCADPYTKELLRYTGMTMGLALAAKREQDRTGRAAGQMQDSLKAVTTRMTKVAESMAAKCGPAPQEPSFADMGEETDDREARAARVAGLTRDQYVVLRERAAAFVLARGGRTGSYVYVAGERAALEGRASDLAAFRKLLGE